MPALPPPQNSAPASASPTVENEQVDSLHEDTEKSTHVHTEIDEKAGSTEAGHDADGGNTSDVLIVDWEGPDDPENPMNWPTRIKITAISIVSILSFLS